MLISVGASFLGSLVLGFVVGWCRWLECGMCRLESATAVGVMVVMVHFWMVVGSPAWFGHESLVG